MRTSPLAPVVPESMPLSRRTGSGAAAVTSAVTARTEPAMASTESLCIEILSAIGKTGRVWQPPRHLSTRRRASRSSPARVVDEDWCQYNEAMADDAEQVLTLGDLFQISDWQHTLDWLPFREGVDIYRLYGDGKNGPTTALLRFHPGARVPLHEHTGYEHILVLAGSQVDENSRTHAGALIINPPRTRHSVLSETGCIVLAIYEKPVMFLETGLPSGGS